MLTAIQNRFVQDWRIPAHLVAKLVALADLAKQQNEHACNGDPHANSTDRANKSKNAAAWESELDKTTADIETLVLPYGFGVTYTGLRPTLTRGEHYVEIPN
jgi:hypothetical protein